MDAFSGIRFLDGDIPWPDIAKAFVTIVVLSSILIRTLFKGEDEQPIPFNVPVPEQCKPDWKGEYLDKPDLKVCTR